MISKIRLFLLILLLFFVNQGFAQNDSLSSVRKLKVVEVSAKGHSTIHSSGSIQFLKKDRLHSLPIIQLSDALKFMSGITVRDYGGVGGMKTVSVRGFGAQHTGIAYDGVSVSDSQTGQVDLGKFSLENVETISLLSGSDEDIFLPARLLSSANLIRMNTLRPVFDSLKPMNLSLQIIGGSFGLINPTFFMENRLLKQNNENNCNVSSSLLIRYIYSKGNYPFTMSYGNNSDSTSREYRDASMVHSLNTEANLFVDFSKYSRWHSKLFYYGSERDLPGAVIFYNTKPAQKLWDQNLFFQTHYEYLKYSKIQFQTYLKFNYAFQRYLDDYYLNDIGKLDNNYRQFETYWSNSVLFKPISILSLSISNDLIYNKMYSNMQDFVYPSRFTMLSLAALNIKTDFVTITGHLLHTFVKNQVQFNNSPSNVNRLSPSLSFLFKPIKKEQFDIRVFYKNIFRLPTFNDLYYREIGNVMLRPERTHQFDFGMAYSKLSARRFILFKFSVDAYYNIVYDKIIAIPSKNLFQWSMLNYGQVSICGADVSGGGNYRINRRFSVEIFGNYSFQRAVDMSDPENKTYGHQIPYTPKHSGSAGTCFKNPWVNVTYSFFAVSARYSLQQNIASNYMLPYSEHSITLSHLFQLKGVNIELKFELLNLADHQYEIIRNYPMPGRSFRLMAKFVF